MKKAIKAVVIIFGVAAIALLLVTFVWPRVEPMIDSARTFSVGDVDSRDAGSVQIDFGAAILKEGTAQQALVVYQRDVDGDVAVSSGLFDLDIFKKTDIVRSYGTGVYTVDLAALGTSSVSVDGESKIVTVRVPHSCLAYISIDGSKTEVVDSDRGFLAFGDLKLTQEQRSYIDENAARIIRSALTTSEAYAAADEAALGAVMGVFYPVVTSLSDEYSLAVEFDRGTGNKDITAEVSKV